MSKSKDKLIPEFIEKFGCYHFRVRFIAQKKSIMENKWYYLPRFSLGDALKNSPKYNYLYEILFEREEQNIDGKKIKPSSPLVIRASKPNRHGFQKGEALDLYITYIGKDINVFRDFLAFLPEWQEFHFMKKHSFEYYSYQLLNPKTNAYENKIAPENTYLDYSFFKSKSVRWDSMLEVQFHTPTTLKINEVFTKEIPYTTLVNRISKRVYDLYYTYFSEEQEGERYLSHSDASILLSQITLPNSATIKRNKKYNMWGVMGSLLYEVPYQETEAVLFAIASYVHVGNHTMVGNGNIRLTIAKDRWIKELSRLLNKKISRNQMIRNDEWIVNSPNAFIGMAKNEMRIKQNGKLIEKRKLVDLRQIRIQSSNVTVSNHVAQFCIKNRISILYDKKE